MDRLISADDIACAIVAACRETGANPIAVASGQGQQHVRTRSEFFAISRARAYAASALHEVFNPEGFAIRVKPSSIAMFVGCTNKYGHDSFLTILAKRRAVGSTPWWDDAAYARVIAAIPPNPHPASFRAEPVPFKNSDLPPIAKAAPSRKIPIGHLEPTGFRPAPGTIAEVLRDDEDDDPVFDLGAAGRLQKSRTGLGPTKSRREMEEDLAAAVRNTAKMTPPPED